MLSFPNLDSIFRGHGGWLLFAGWMISAPYLVCVLSDSPLRRTWRWLFLGLLWRRWYTSRAILQPVVGGHHSWAVHRAAECCWRWPGPWREPWQLRSARHAYVLGVCYNLRCDDASLIWAASLDDLCCTSRIADASFVRCFPDAT